MPEIAAWELAAGGADHAAAWVLNLGAAMIGMVICPLRFAAAAAATRCTGLNSARSCSR